MFRLRGREPNGTRSPEPFRPSATDLERIADDVRAIPDIQSELLTWAEGLATRDRVAHQYQIAGGRVALTVADSLPRELNGVGLFEASRRHDGVARISTGLGCPHSEGEPDFLGLRLSFRDSGGRRIDFIAINDPASPTDDHRGFVALLRATASGARARRRAPRPPLVKLLASNLGVTFGLIRGLGALAGSRIALHVLRQTVPTALSTTAVQRYWTGVVEVGGVFGKFIFVPHESATPAATSASPRVRRLSDDWRRRQAAAPILFDMLWTPFISERATPTDRLSRAWRERPRRVATVMFPHQAPDEAAASRWAALASEMRASPGNWATGDAAVVYPSSEFATARMLAYRSSQEGRGALAEEWYAEVFETGTIGPALARELDARCAAKRAIGHVDQADYAP